jgi:hypothetical protein
VVILDMSSEDLMGNLEGDLKLSKGCGFFRISGSSSIP